MKFLKPMLLSGIVLTSLLSFSAVSTHASTMSIDSNGGHAQLSDRVENNLIQNGNFKEGLDFWENVSFGGGSISVKTEGEENYVELATPIDNSGSAIVQSLLSSQLRKYNISFWYKGSDNGKFIFQASGGEIYDELHIVNLIDSQDIWKEYKGTIVMPQDNWITWDKLSLGFISGENGNPGSINPLRIKDVQLTEIKDNK